MNEWFLLFATFFHTARQTKYKEKDRIMALRLVLLFLNGISFDSTRRENVFLVHSVIYFNRITHCLDWRKKVEDISRKREKQNRMSLQKNCGEKNFNTGLIHTHTRTTFKRTDSYANYLIMTKETIRRYCQMCEEKYHRNTAARVLLVCRSQQSS